jgi:serine/threonine-protein kinase
LVFLVHQPALAQEASRAEELFHQGQTLMKEGDYDAACPKLQESERIDPATGTLLNLAVCHEAQGRTATAWAEYQEASERARRDGRADRVQYADARIAELEPQLVRLTISLPPSHAVKDLLVRLDGQPVGQASYNVPFPIDPGGHTIGASAPGRVSWEILVDVAADQVSAEVSIPELELAAAEPPVAIVPPVSTSLSPERDGNAPQKEPGFFDALSTTQTVSLGFGAAGVVGVGLGTGFGITALVKSNKADCPDRDCQSSEDLELYGEAQSWGNRSTTAFVAGAVCTAVAVTLWLVDRQKKRTLGSARFSPANHGYLFAGSF